MEVKRERYPYCVVLDFMVHYFKNEWRWDVDIKDTFYIYTKTIISLGSKSTLGSTTKKLEFGDDEKLDFVRTNVSFYYGGDHHFPPMIHPPSITAPSRTYTISVLHPTRQSSLRAWP